MQIKTRRNLRTEDVIADGMGHRELEFRLLVYTVGRMETQGLSKKAEFRLMNSIEQEFSSSDTDVHLLETSTPINHVLMSLIHSLGTRHASASSTAGEQSPELYHTTAQGQSQNLIYYPQNAPS